MSRVFKVGQKIRVKRSLDAGAWARSSDPNVPDGEYTVTEVANYLGQSTPRVLGRHGNPWWIPSECVEPDAPFAVGDQVELDVSLDPEAARRSNAIWASTTRKPPTLATVAEIVEGGFISGLGRFIPWGIVVPKKPRTWQTTAIYDGTIDREATKNSNLPEKRYLIDVLSECNPTHVKSTERRYPRSCLREFKSVSSDGFVIRKIGNLWHTERKGYPTLEAAQKSFD